MASSATGERRWGSAKRGGMTVLGKVAVPKPINLPSQRLENHGLDPTVEIVPKGSLSWGARSSSSGSNAWGSSPRAEGSSGSPSRLSGRPSSSGGTRPSTAGSERNHDTASNAWIANLRPSSASGILAANTTSLAALRPRSAETRPGSSQLSRFAEPLSEGTSTCCASGAGDKLGMAASSNDGFSLSSGDFPTLGEEKISGKNVESLDCNNTHGGPGSSGPSTTTEKMERAPDGDISRLTDDKNSMANSWEKDVPHPGMERWHGDSYPYPNHNIPPHPYENWPGGPPVNPPGQVWFRGPPGARPYGTPPMAAPGGFPMEPFPYYCPQVPAPGLANSQTVLPQGGRPSGPPYSKNGDLCRPYIDSYMRPGMPMRPDFFPGFYRQPMGFCSPSEQDPSLMGRPSGPPVFNKYPNWNAPEPTSSNARSCGGRAPEQVESGPLLDPRASVLVKQIKGWDKSNKEDRFGHKLTPDAHPHDNGRAANASSQDKFWSEDLRKDKQMNHGKKSLHSVQAPLMIKDKTGFTDPALVKFHGNTNSAQSSDVNLIVENVALPKDRTLIQKIEGLNAKVRASDGKHDFCREEHNGRGQVVNSNVNINEASASVHIEGHYSSGMLPVSYDRTILADDKGFGSTVGSVGATISRHSSHNPQGRGVHGSKGRLNSQEADGWRKRSSNSDSHGIVSVVNSERTFRIQRREQHCTEMSSSNGEKDNSRLSILEPSIGEHANMKEISKQRAIQLQKEEEERIREQKAKALAKLEELNSRSVKRVKETSRQKIDEVPSHPDSMQRHQESKTKIELQFGSFQSGEIDIALASGYNASKSSHGLESSVSSGIISSQTNQQLSQEHFVLSQKQSVPAIDDTQIDDVAGHQNVQCHDATREKEAGYKQMYNVRSLSEKPIVYGKDKHSTTIAMLKEVNAKGVLSCSESNRVGLPTVSDSLLHPKRKNSRAGKNKHMVDESFSASSASVQKEFEASRGAAENMKLAATEQKSHRNDTAAWAPVKSHTKIEAVDENDEKSDEGAGPLNRNDNSVPSSSKGRRAEIDRYVPKAAIKGLAQRGSDQLYASVESSIPDGTNIQGRLSSQTTERPKRTVESRYVENKTKQWNRRNSTEANLVQASGNSLMSMTGPAKGPQTSDGAHQTQKPKEPLKGSVAKPVSQLEEVLPSIQDEHLGKQQLQSPEANEDNAVDGWVIYEEPASYDSAMVSGMEGNGKLFRGKKNPYKGPKGSRNHQNVDRESHSGGAKCDEEYFPDTIQAEKPASSKEHHMAQWQPKPQTHVANQHGNHARGRQTVTSEDDRIYKRQGSKVTVKNMVQPENHYAPGNGSYSPKENTVGNIESAPLGQTNLISNEHRPSSSGNRWNGNYNGHFNRGREFHGDRSFISQDNRHSHVPSHQEKQKQNAHYEYQPVGSHIRNKRGNNLEGQTENQHAGSKFRDRGQGSHSQRGGARFHG